MKNLITASFVFLLCNVIAQNKNKYHYSLLEVMDYKMKYFLNPAKDINVYIDFDNGKVFMIDSISGFRRTFTMVKNPSTTDKNIIDVIDDEIKLPFVITLYHKNDVEILECVHSSAHKFKLTEYSETPIFYGTYRITENYDKIKKNYELVNKEKVWEVFFDKRNSLILVQDSATGKFIKYEILSQEAAKEGHNTWRVKSNRFTSKLDFYSTDKYNIIDCIQDSFPNNTRFKNKKDPIIKNDIITISNTKWQGYYTCGQGKTELGLEIIYENYKWIAYFNFKNNEIEKGKYSLIGNYNKVTKELTFVPNNWIDKPDGYDMVGLTGILSNDNSIFKGKIDNTSCGDFYLKKLKL